MPEYDLVVVGGGSGGLAVSKRAADKYGKKVLLVEKGPLGGTCVNVGCIPKKMLYNAALLFSECKTLLVYSKHPNRTQNTPEFNWDEFRAKRDKYINYLNDMYARRNEKDRVHVISGQASLEKGRTVCVSALTHTGRHVLIATGSQPVPLKCPGMEHCITSNEFFSRPKMPQSIVIVGTGYIAIETGAMLSSFGAKVTVISRHSGILSSFSQTLSVQTAAKLEVEPAVRILRNADVIRVEIRKNPNGLPIKRVVYKNKQKNHSQPHDVKCGGEHTQKDCSAEWVEAEEVLVAVGRYANTVGMDLLAKDGNGFVCTSDTFETSEPGVYAIGDVAFREDMLTPVAIFAGRRLADFLFGGIPCKPKMMIRSVPTVIFTHPPSGSVGITEQQALEPRSHPLKKKVLEYQRLQALVGPNKPPSRNTCVFIYSEETGEIEGVHSFGAGSDEQMQGLAVLVRCKVSMEQISEYLEWIGSSWEEYFMGI